MNPSAPSLVSIVIPTLNRRGLLMQTLDSLCDQTYPHWEAVVVDDGSTDGTDAMMERFCRWEPRIRYMRRQGDLAGANVCRNQGVEASQGEYIIFLDSDDLLMPHCLQVRVAVMQDHPELDFGVFMGTMFRVDPSDASLLHNVFTEDDDLDRFLRNDNPWSVSGPIWRRRTLRAPRVFDPVLPIAQDWELHVRTLLSAPIYTKIASCDYYVRLPSSGRESIGATTPSLASCVAGASVRIAVCRPLQESGHWTESRRHALAGLVTRLIQDLVRMSATDQSRELCRRAGEVGLLSGAEARVLDRILGVTPRLPGLRRMKLAAIRIWRHNSGFRMPGPTTIMSTRVAGT